MIDRSLAAAAQRGLGRIPVVAIVGPRQVGKTTLALEVARRAGAKPTYLDLERDSDRNKLADAELYLGKQHGKLTILDEVQRRPELFASLRALVDERVRDGERAGQFLVLGSASRDMLRQSSESLAGRIAYFELRPFSVAEVGSDATSIDRLWLRGGFPPSYLAADDTASWEWRGNFVGAYLERDLPQLGLRLPAEQMRRLWTMLSHGQGDPLNVARLAAGLGLSGHTVRRYLDVLTDLYMVRQLEPWSGNSRKRLVKSPKVYVRDTGLLHRLANVPDEETLLGSPLCGRSWEGFAIEQILAGLADVWRPSYFRTSAGAEIDLVLEGPGRAKVAIEIKRTLSPKPEKGFLLGCDEVRATRRVYAMPRGERHSLGGGIESVPLAELAAELAATSPAAFDR